MGYNMKKLSAITIGLLLTSSPYAQAAFLASHGGAIPNVYRWMPPGPGSGTIPQNVYAPDASHLSLASRSAVFTTYAATSCISYFLNEYNVNTIETLPGNAYVLNYGQVENGTGNFTNITFGGSGSATNASGGLVSTDPYPVTVGPNGQFWLNFGVSVSAAQNMPTGFRIADTIVGEAQMFAATPFTYGQVITGTAGSIYSHLFTPTLTVCLGYDGRVTECDDGDSIGIGNGTFAVDGRHNYTAWEKFLDAPDSKGLRLPYWNLSVSGDAGLNQSTNYTYRQTLWNALHNIPCTSETIEMGRNDGNLPGMRAAYYLFLKTRNGGIWQAATTLSPRVADAAADGTACDGVTTFCSGFTTSAGQSTLAANTYPSGQLWVYNIGIAAGTYNGATLDKGVDLNDIMGDAANGFPDRHPNPGWCSTVNTAININDTTAVLNDKPPLNITLSFDPFTASNDVGNQYTVGVVTGTGPYTVTFYSSAIGNVQKIAKAHAQNSIVCSRGTTDGSHKDNWEQDRLSTALQSRLRPYLH